MGTSSIFKRHNDYGARLASMKKEELENLDKASAWSKNQDLPGGWSLPLELHNSDIEILVWWGGTLMRLENAAESELLHRKFWNRYKGKTETRSEWRVVMRMVRYSLQEAERRYLRKHRALALHEKKEDKVG